VPDEGVVLSGAAGGAGAGVLSTTLDEGASEGVGPSEAGVDVVSDIQGHRCLVTSRTIYADVSWFCPAGGPMPHIASKHERHVGRSVGTGHCVPFVREVTGLGHTSTWRRGEPVRDGNHASGTAIATFDDDGKYGNHVDGRSHCAILVAVQENGLLVWDQWLNHPVQQRVIRFRDGKGDAVNDGDRYFVIDTA
jgi:hypothetical protein